MVFIVSRMLQRAINHAKTSGVPSANDDAWKAWMLSPYDYGKEAVFDPDTRKWMAKIEFSHGGKEYDDKYPEGIPTSLKMEFDDGSVLDSGLVMFPSGHALNTTADLMSILAHKNQLLGGLALEQ